MIHNNQYKERTHQSKNSGFAAINAIPQINWKHKKTITDAEQPKKVPNSKHPPKKFTQKQTKHFQKSNLLLTL